MARIRTIKPEFWDSPDTARASHTARLFYIALWNWADDYGKGTASPKQLIGFAFPNDDNITVADYPRLASEAQSAWKVVFYEVDGRPYYYIPSFLKHQRTEKRATSRIPDPPEGISAGQSHNHGSSVDSVGSSAPIVGYTVPGTGEQGNRGTGEQVLSPQAAQPAKPSSRKRHVPDDWQPNTHHHELAAELHLNLVEQVAQFRDHDKSKGPIWKDHDAGFNNWLRNAAKWGRSSRNTYGKQQETDQLFDAAMQRAIARDQQELMP